MSKESSAPRVALFVTCMVDTLYPEVGLAAASILERHGVEVVCPESRVCCGQPFFNAGYRRYARSAAHHFLDVFHNLLRKKEVTAIVAPSGSCVAMVRQHYRTLFEGAEHDSERQCVQVVSAATYELSEYLVDELGVAETGAHFPATLAYHPCCHLLRELNVDTQPRRLLAGVEDAQVVELPDADHCCGFGGVFAVKNAEISTAMGRRKVESIAATGADYVVVNDVSCMSHLNGLLRREGYRNRAIHIARVLERCAGSTPPGDVDAR